MFTRLAIVTVCLFASSIYLYLRHYCKVVYCLFVFDTAMNNSAAPAGFVLQSCDDDLKFFVEICEESVQIEHLVEEAVRGQPNRRKFVGVKHVKAHRACSDGIPAKDPWVHILLMTTTASSSQFLAWCQSLGSMRPPLCSGLANGAEIKVRRSKFENIGLMSAFGSQWEGVFEVTNNQMSILRTIFLSGLDDTKLRDLTEAMNPDPSGKLEYPHFLRQTKNYTPDVALEDALFVPS